jgi:hypothetical protein
LIDNDAAVSVVRMGDTPDATSAGDVSVTAFHDPISLITCRPSIGKRKAKLLEFAKKKRMKFSLSLRQRLSSSRLILPRTDATLL